MSEFNFGPEISYDHSLIRDKVFWPCVDSLWNGDWRAESKDGHSFIYPRAGFLDGREVTVELTAECDVVPDTYDEEDEEVLEQTDYDPDERGHSLCFSVEETLTGVARNIGLASAKRSAAARKELADEEELDEEGEWEWPLGNEDTFELRSGQSYEYSSEGELIISTYHVVLSPFYNLTVPAFFAEDQFQEPEKIQKHDLAVIRSGLVVLRAPKLILRALEDVEQRPIEAH